MRKDTVEITRWKHVKDDILPLNPQMERKVGQLASKLNDLEVLIARYPFGANIERNGKFSVLLDGKMTECKKHIVPREVSDLLDYPWKTMPLSMVSKGSFEMFINIPSHVIPLHLYEPGEMMALFGMYDQDKYSHLVRQAYSTTAGARSLVTLPKISHGLYNQRLSKKFAIFEHLSPKTLGQQWDLFRELCHSPILPSPWQAELIVFSHDFVDVLRKTPEIENEILSKMIEITNFSRSQAMYDLLWSLFTDEYSLVSRNTPFIIETCKHLIKLAMSEAPGYAPATDDIPGPIVELTDIFLNVYKLRYYLPIFMRPSTYNGQSPVYYTLHKHTFLHSIPQKNAANRTIDELTKIKEIITAFKSFVLEDKFPFSVADTNLYDTFRSVDIDFFHPQGSDELNTDIMSIVHEDDRFMKIVERFNINKELSFPDHSVFFNGCIRIRPTAEPETIEPEEIRPKATMKDFLATMRR